MPAKCKTRTICTIGPASDSPEILEAMIRTGMTIARLNFSHGDFSSHSALIRSIRSAAEAAGQRVAILADLPGPKIRIGELEEESINLQAGNFFTLTSRPVIGSQECVSVSFKALPAVVKPGDRLYINDGIIQLEVVSAEETQVRCRILVGGEIRSRKGLNLPDIDLGISAFTEHDAACLEFAMEQGIDAVSQSFVTSAVDVARVRENAEKLGYRPFIIAKIERSMALQEIDSILDVSDGIMIARGDLGVEIPIERMAVVQKQLMNKANRLGKPVITATQMLHSRVSNRRPTRAESTDVANAILDGTDCVMLSEESAMGAYPVAAVDMLVRIAEETEPHRPAWPLREALKGYGRDGDVSLTDLITLSVELTLQRVHPEAVVVPTTSGGTARNISRFKLPVCVTAFSPSAATCQELLFSYGVQPVLVERNREDWGAFTREWLRAEGIDTGLALLVQGPSSEHPRVNHRMEIIDLSL